MTQSILHRLWRLVMILYLFSYSQLIALQNCKMQEQINPLIRLLLKKRENKKREKKREKKKRAKKRAKKREKPGSPTRYSSPVPHAIGRPHDSSSASDSFSLRYCTIPGNTRTARYIPVRQLTGRFCLGQEGNVAANTNHKFSVKDERDLYLV
ncbi:hypothetical protein GW17_00017371 [Ensete ventricosum]|nr:hypothetical protein GW17_00017371 [Ensete ventricosum]